MASTTGKVSSRVRTERVELTASDFAAEMERLEQYGESINGLVYADSNVGKTVLAGTCPGKQLWLAGEPGYKSAARQGAKGLVRKIPDTATALAALDWLEGPCKDGSGPRYSKLDWLILDGASTMQDKFRFSYAAEAFDVSGGTKRAHRNLPDKPDYFNTQNFLKNWIARLVDLPVNLLVTAHAYRTTETEDGERLVFPGFQGKVNETANAIAGLMDFVGYYTPKHLRVRGKDDETRMVRRLLFESPAPRKGEEEVRYVCGDKFNVFGSHVDNPTMPKLISMINGEETPDAQSQVARSRRRYHR